MIIPGFKNTVLNLFPLWMGHIPGAKRISFRYRIKIVMPPIRHATINRRYPVIRSPDRADMIPLKSRSNRCSIFRRNHGRSIRPFAPFDSSTDMAPPRKLKII